MRTLLTSLVAGTMIFAAVDACAQESKKRFGNWEVTIDTDRFNGQSKVIAGSFQNGDLVAVRCFPNGVSVVVGELGLGPGRFDEGMEFEIKFRADKKDIIESYGVALNDKVVQIAESQPMARQMRYAKEVAFRLVYKGVVVDKVFSLGKGGAKALDEVFKACPEPA